VTAVLTKESTVECGHGGTVSTTGSAKLTVNQKGVLLKDGLDNGTVSSACSNVVDTSKNLAKCATLTASGGEATKLTVGDKPVMLASVIGSTDGKPPTPPPKIEAVQTKLTAI
jgi:hypothetical protein